MTQTKASAVQAAYDKKNTKGLYLKLNLKTDADILAWLEAQENKQGSIKTLIRWASAVDKVREAYAEALADETFCDREEAAYNAADNTALAIVWGWHGITVPAQVVNRNEKNQIVTERKILMLASIGEE